MGENTGMNATSRPIRRADSPDTLTIDGHVASPTTVDRPVGSLDGLIRAAGPTGDHATVHSGDGLFGASIPLDVVRSAALSAEGRLVIDTPPTKCWLVKDVRRIEITEGRQPDSLPEEERAKT